MSDVPESKRRSLANLRPPVQVGEVLNPYGRRGKVSMLDAIRKELLRHPTSNPDGISNNEAIARRLVSIALNARDADALTAIKLLLAYFEGEPTKPVKLEIRRAAVTIANRTGADPDWLIMRAEQLASELYDQGLNVFGSVGQDEEAT